jgi:acyl-CoA dehydrogenase
MDFVSARLVDGRWFRPLTVLDLFTRESLALVSGRSWTGIKVAAAHMALRVLDRAIQVHGGGGVSQDFPLARDWAIYRTLRIADGPDEVHLETVAKEELKGQARRVAATM